MQKEKNLKNLNKNLKKIFQIYIYKIFIKKI